MDKDKIDHLEEAQFEALIQGLLEEEYGCCDDFVDADLQKGLRERLRFLREAGEMHPAGIGRKFDFQRNLEVRGDLIRWIERDYTGKYEDLFLAKVDRFVRYLNQTCYAGINASEFHYADYEPGSFYKRHLDQFKSEKGRKYSMVLYLNDQWGSEDGGHLSLYRQGDRLEKVLPISGRLVFFRSDELEHEVHPAPERHRLSIAGWLKSV